MVRINMTVAPLSATGQGLEGIHRGVKNLQAAAYRDTAGPTEEAAVERVAARAQVGASIQLIRGADDTLGTLLDIMA